jgi:hypothetical protein
MPTRSPLRGGATKLESAATSSFLFIGGGTNDIKLRTDTFDLRECSRYFWCSIKRAFLT